MNLTEFQHKVSTAEKPIVIDFWAPWCMPCKVTKPILESLAHEYADKVEFLPINAYNSRDVLEHFKVIGIPTVLTIRNGEVAGRVKGAQNKPHITPCSRHWLRGRKSKFPCRHSTVCSDWVQERSW